MQAETPNFVRVSRTMAIAIALAGVLAISGCAGLQGGPGMPGGPGTDTPAEVVEGYDCLAPNLGGWAIPEPDGEADPEHPDAPAPGRVPEGFIPVAAYTCDLMGTVEDAEGRWMAVTVRQLEGDLAGLLDALAEPDDGRSTMPCTADAEIVPPLWLVDASGHAINAHYPRDGCGKTKPGVRGALATLTVVDTITLKRDLIEPRAAMDAGCSNEWTAPWRGWLGLALPMQGLEQPSDTGTSDGAGSPGSPGLLPAPSDVDSMRWCRYAVDATTPDPGAPIANQESPPFEGTITLETGLFTAGGVLDQEDAHRILAVATGSPADASCAESATAFVVLWPMQGGQLVGAPLSADLDGCHFLYPADGQPRQLPDEARQLVTSVNTTG